ncbi:hypothetical protein BIV57_15690 [Mangrovactinospora gilvigrisea]|uniref:HTH luxR-type domain-containing protein n=1 Tax=Mangrovactinospora gilvigrisea TaxID=1428644 RepID=A0A1J7BD41_9ACTN|nr:hypothetical protein BIV57_15690 [Mangrovactinospora gilvigrisea]
MPAEVTGFVGRAAELVQVRALLADARLVTLVGPGGVGKSRVALRAAADTGPRFADGVRFVQLSALHDRELLPAAVAGLLGLTEQPGREPIDLLVEYLRHRQVLLLLDTCEHLLDGCAMLADVLLREAPMCTVLATSRQPLDVPGEHAVPLAPLPPEDAVELFGQRAANVRPGFRVTDANRPSVERLCTRLDGMPLAIELATVRLRALPAEQLAELLESRFRVLTVGRRPSASDPSARHRTLRAAIDWSHELCTPGERLLWARLSVFAGPFDVAAAEAVCGDRELPAEEILDQLIGLVDKSVLLRVDEPAPGGADGVLVRYRLLDTLREYGAERLADADGARRAAERRHAAHFFGLARDFQEGLLADDQVARFAELQGCLPDVRAALERSFAGDGADVTAGLGAAAGLWPLWITSGMIGEGRAWVRRGLEAARAAALPEGPETAWALVFGGLLTVYQAEIEAALEMFRRARALAEELGDELMYGYAVGYEGGMLRFLGQDADGRALLAEARAVAQRVPGMLHKVMFAFQTSYTCAVLGDLAEAEALSEEALELLARCPGERILAGQVRMVRSFLAWSGGDREAAVRETRDALAASVATGEAVAAAHGLEMMAGAAAEAGRWERAAWLLGAAGEVWELVGAPAIGAPPFLELRGRTEEAARGGLGDDPFERLYREGGRLDRARAIELALADAERPAGPSVPAQRRPEGALTRREREVAALVARGMTNREIAERLVISKRTADAHVEHILGKLGFSSRTEITGYWTR